MNSEKKTIRIIAGPTASGKSARAVELARAENGIIINCDSMQLYDGLPILTAQPSEEDKQKAPHLLYGALHPGDMCSAGDWCKTVRPLIEKTLQEGRTPIVVGGTGLYIKALMEGLSPIPEIPEDVREAAEALQRELGNPGFHAALAGRDPVMAGRLHPSNTQRLVRAWEVLEHTGRSLAEWQSLDKVAPPAHWHFEIEIINPPREELYRRCDERFLKMMDMGAPGEVKDFSGKIESGEIHEGVALTKALGFKHLREYLRGNISRDEAIALSQADTRHYAKRQTTWFRNQL